LRRFGFQDASQTLSFAVSTAVGRRHRLVTLDDAGIVARGTPPTTRKLVRAGRWIAVSVAAVAIVFLVQWVHGGGLDDLMAGIADGVLRPDQSILEAFGAILAGAVLAVVVGVFVLALLIVPVAVATTAGLAASRAASAVRKAEKARQLTLSEEREIEGGVAEIVRRSRKILAPRLVVVRCTDAVWKQTVSRLAAECQTAIIDVSVPSDNVVWEVETVAALKARAVFVGQRDKVAALAQTRPPRGKATQHLRTLLADADVLVYDDQDPAAQSRFAKALGARLDRIGSALA
jgi:hypothetical protein